MSSKKFRFSFFLLLGIISALGQAVLLREMVTVFYGNELTYSLGLAIWLAFTGLGSLLATKFNPREKNALFLWLILAWLSFLLPLICICLRFVVAQTVPTGELPNLWFTFLLLGISFLFFCLPLGAVFPLAILSSSGQKEKALANKAYFWETIGFSLAGLFFSLVLATTYFPLPKNLHFQSLSWRYPQLAKTANSKYSQITITKTNSQENFFLNGQLAFTNQESLENRKLLNLVKPFTKETKVVLLLGNPSLTKEIWENFAPNSLDYLEIDQKLLEMEREILAEETTVIGADPRKFLRQTEKQWGLVIYSPGNPQTLSSNRYFTKESFLQVKNHLEKNGLFVLTFYLPTDYQSQEAARLGSSIFQTLENVFPFTELLITEDQLILLSGNEEIKIDNAKIDPVFVNYFWHQIKSEERTKIISRLSEVKEKINTDLEPISFFHQQLFWQTFFNFQIPKLTRKMIRILPFLLFITIIIFLNKGKQKLCLGLLAANCSFLTMSLETLTILLFQIKIGYLYSQITLIFAAVLSGIALGVKIIEKQSNFLKSLKVLFLALLITVLFLFYLPSTRLAQETFFWLGLAFLLGGIGGGIFASVNNLYLAQANRPGFIYSFDLFGGSLGALLTSNFLLPIFGTRNLLIGAILMILISLWTVIAKLRQYD